MLSSDWTVLFLVFVFVLNAFDTRSVDTLNGQLNDRLDGACCFISFFVLLQLSYVSFCCVFNNPGSGTGDGVHAFGILRQEKEREPYRMFDLKENQRVKV